MCPIAALVKWFPQSKGLVSGLAVAGFGFGAFLFSNKHLMVSAENYIKTHGVSKLFLAHGIVSFLAIVIGAMLLRNPPTAAAPPSAGPTPAQSDSTWQDTLRRPGFYLLWLMFFSGAMAGLMVIGILKGFAGDQLLDAARSGGAEWMTDALAEARASIGDGYNTWLTKFDTAAGAAERWTFDKGVAAVGWLAIFNAVGRIVWGFVSDRIGRTATFIAMFLIQAAMMVVLATLNTELSLAVGASIIGFNFGGNFALFPSATADIFGSKNIGANYGWVFTSYGIAGVVGIAAGNAAKASTGEYRYAFYAAAALCVIAAGLAVALRVMQKRTQAVAA